MRASDIVGAYYAPSTLTSDGSDSPGQLTLDRSTRMDQLKMAQTTSDRLAEREFRDGDAVVNSDVLGPIDSDHVSGAAGFFRQALRDVETSARTGRPVVFQFENGSSIFTRLVTPYRVSTPPDATQDDKIAIARELTLSFMYSYEENSVIAGGFGNTAAETVGRGTSAFSTEDLVSNAMGVMAAEHFVKSNGFAALDELSIANLHTYAHNFVADRAGDIQPAEDDTVQSFGNRDYLPEHQNGHRRSTAELNQSDAYRYLQARQEQFKSQADFSPEHGHGWRLFPAGS